MNNQQFICKIKEMCTNNNESISSFLMKCSLRKSFIYDVEKRNAKPSIEIIETIANYFDCSVDYLLGRTNTVKSLDLPNEFIEAITSSFGKSGKFINLNDLVAEQPKIKIKSKKYFIRSAKNFQLETANINDDYLIMEIYRIAKEYNSEIISEKEYRDLFKNFKEIEWQSYNASYYELTKQEYSKFLNVYEDYKNGVVLSAFENYKNNGQ